MPPIETKKNTDILVSDDLKCAYVDVDLNFWAKMPFWTALELPCITLGFDPERLLNASLEELQKNTQNFDKLSKRSQLTHRAKEHGQLDERITPKAAIDWLKSIREV